MVNSLLYCSAFYCAAKSLQHASHFIPIRVGHTIKALSKVGVTVNGQNIGNKSAQEIEDLVVKEALKQGFNPKKAPQQITTYKFTISNSLLKRDFQINVTTLKNIEALTKAFFYGFCAYGYIQAVR